MQQERNILFISNGYGEDKVAAHIARRLRESYSGYTARGFPTVGNGMFYEQSHIECAGTGLRMPSEGFIRSLKDFLSDLLHGFFRKTLKLGLSLREVSQHCDALVVVGDPYLLLFTSVFTRGEKKKRVFVGLQQSEWYGSKKPFKEHYSFIERLWLNWWASLIIVRDKKTSDYLRDRGLSAVVSFGNPMMDCFSVNEKELFPEDKVAIGVLPGSKREAYENFRLVMEIAKELEKLERNEKDFIFAVALSPNLDIDTLIMGSGLERSENSNLFKKHGPESHKRRDFALYSHRDLNSLFTISKEHFGSFLSRSKAVIGLSGTGNEQAAGMGKPVFAFWGKGPQITRKFLEAQKRLLGISLFVFPPKPRIIAEKISELLCDEEKIEEISNNGKMRMGGEGSIHRIADEIHRKIGKR